MHHRSLVIVLGPTLLPSDAHADRGSRAEEEDACPSTDTYAGWLDLIERESETERERDRERRIPTTRERHTYANDTYVGWLALIEHRA